MKRFAIAFVLLTLTWSASAELTNEEINSRLNAFMDAAAAEGFTGAVTVARKGKVLLEAGYGLIDPDDDRPVRADSVFTTGSITKQFTAAAIMKLEMTGKLSVDDPITKFFENVPEDKRKITLHQLLTHTAGLPGAIGDDRERIGRDDFVRLALGERLLFAPGSKYEYSNVGFSLLAAIVETVSGQDYESFLKTSLFDPAGMKDTGYNLPKWKPERLAHGKTDDGGDWGTLPDKMFTDGGPGWHLLGNGGINSTVKDMRLWHDAMMGDRILSAAAKKKMYTRHADEGGGTWYGYGWSIEPTEWGEMITHNGGNPYFFADFLRFPEADVVIYYNSSTRERRMNRLGRKLARIVFTGEVSEIGPSDNQPMQPLEAPPAEPGSLAAKWGLPGSFRGARGAELLEALVNEKYRDEFVRGAFAPDVLERRGVEGLMQAIARLSGEVGDFDLHGARPSGSGVIVALTSKSKGVRFEIEINLEPDEPHRITGIGVEAGG